MNLTKEQQLILLGLIASIVIGLCVMGYRHIFPQKSGEISIEEPKSSEIARDANLFIVHVSGAVRREGVYKLKAGDRLLDALDLAGGALSSADLSEVNLAEPVKDGQKIIIPVRYKTIEMGSDDRVIRKSGKRSGKINLNTADEKDLDSLPGIGKSTAKKIIEYRKANGPFARTEQIMEIPRFGKSKYEKIKDKIVI